VFVENDGLSGALTEDDRPALKAMFEAAKRREFNAVVMVEQSRLFRENVDAQLALRTFRRLGIDVWITRESRLINATTFESKVLASITGLLDEAEREKTIRRVKDAYVDRFDKGYLVSSVPFGYIKERTGTGAKAPFILKVNDAQADVVRRIFGMSIAGASFGKIATQLNNEKVPPPTTKKWSISAVREILGRELYNGVIVTGKVVRTGPNKSKDRKRVPPSEWKRREVAGLRIVTPDQWNAVRARLATSNRNYLRTADGKLVSKPETSRGEHLLSGFLVCGEPNAERPRGICGAPLTVLRHGKNGRQAYACRDHREKRGCTNKSALPYLEAHRAIIAALRRTFTVESYEAHLASISNDHGAHQRREAERTNLLAEMQRLAAVEKKLAALVEATDDVEALVERLKAAQAERKAAEQRLAYLEGVEVDIRAGREQVEKLKTTWAEWSELLGAHEAPGLPEGTYGAVLARSILRKILVSPIVVVPVTEPVDLKAWARATCGAGEPAPITWVTRWQFKGVSSFDAVFSGGLSKAQIYVDIPWDSPDVLRCMGLENGYNGPHPISGGSDAHIEGVSGGRGPEMAPHTPTLRAPAEPWRFASVHIRGAEMAPQFAWGPRHGPQPPSARHAPGHPGRSSVLRAGGSPLHGPRPAEWSAVISEHTPSVPSAPAKAVALL
jgi:DNA invertase Pin-like site-specific DNA recombinase